MIFYLNSIKSTFSGKSIILVWLLSLLHTLFSFFYITCINFFNFFLLGKSLLDHLIDLFHLLIIYFSFYLDHCCLFMPINYYWFILIHFLVCFIVFIDNKVSGWCYGAKGWDPFVLYGLCWWLKGFIWSYYTSFSRFIFCIFHIWIYYKFTILNVFPLNSFRFCNFLCSSLFLYCLFSHNFDWCFLFILNLLL